MLSFKRFLYIVLIVASLGGVFLIYSIIESQPASVQLQMEREFTEMRQLNAGEKPRVWILGNSDDGRYGEIYDNILQFCGDIHLTVAGEGHLNMSEVKERDLVIFCDASVSHYADLSELEKFIAGGGRVILAAGLAEGDGDSCLWPALGILEKSEVDDYHNLVFEKPLLPVQPEQAYYAGRSGSARIEVSANASVYIRDTESGAPILYTYAWQKGCVCLINGSFLADIHYVGLMTGAIGALLPDFIYPVLGTKAVFLDNFPSITPENNKFCKQMYGYSVEGFVRDVVWPVFQGITLRTDTPCTVSMASDDALSASVGKSVLRFGGELADAEYIVFPAATMGNSMVDGNLFAICSVLGAYGMVSHVFDVDMLIASDGNAAAWDSDKRQIGIFESEILTFVPWLEGRTLSQTEDDARSYQDMDYGWVKGGSRIELDCSSIAKGQAFFYHTDDRIVDAEGLTYQDVGNGYYLLRVQENHAIITLEEGK